MRCRSDSVRRTVVDLSFSFFMTGNFCIRTIGLSLPRSSEDARRHLNDISEISRCEEYL
jgi:hypothetical protein